MIIDGQAEFRSLLRHHLSTHWQDAIISEYDPVTSGYLPDEFSGAGNDVVLLGSDLGDREGMEIVRKFLEQPTFPALIYFGSEQETDAMLDRGVYLAPSAFEAGFVSAAHTAGHIEATVAAARESFELL